MDTTKEIKLTETEKKEVLNKIVANFPTDPSEDEENVCISCQ